MLCKLDKRGEIAKVLHEQCSSGITSRALRWAIRDELLLDPLLAAYFAQAAGIGTNADVGEIALRYKAGLMISFAEAGRPIDVTLDIHIDKLMSDPTPLPMVEAPPRRRSERRRRVVTVAPKAWFTANGNAEDVGPVVTLEQLKDRGSVSFRSAIDQACERADRALQELRRPKVKLPGWVKRRLWA